MKTRRELLKGLAVSAFACSAFPSIAMQKTKSNENGGAAPEHARGEYYPHVAPGYYIVVFVNLATELQYFVVGDGDRMDTVNSASGRMHPISYDFTYASANVRPFGTLDEAKKRSRLTWTWECRCD